MPGYEEITSDHDRAHALRRFRIGEKEWIEPDYPASLGARLEDRIEALETVVTRLTLALGSLTGSVATLLDRSED